MSGLETLSDEELAASAGAGDQVAFAVLTQRYTAMLEARIASRLHGGVRRRVAASDVLQEAYVAALRRLADFKDRGEGSFGRWMERIVESRIHDVLRRHVGASKRSVGQEVTRGGRGPNEARAAQGPSPSQVEIGREFKEAVRRALASLPEESREVIRLIQDERVDLAEAAERMGRTRGAAKMLYVRALARLEDVLELETRQRHGRRRPTR